MQTNTRAPFVFKDENGDPIDFDSLSEAEASAMMAEVDELLASLNMQIDDSKSRGRHDPDWLRRVKTKRKIQAMMKQRLQRRLSQLKVIKSAEAIGLTIGVTENPQHRIYKEFYEICQQELPDELFQKLRHEAIISACPV